MKTPKSNHQAGFSLLEVLLAVSIMGGISYFLMSMFQQSGRSVNQLGFQIQREQLRMVLIGQVLSSPENCKCLITGSSAFPVAGTSELVGYTPPLAIGRFQSNDCTGGIPSPFITTTGIDQMKLMSFGIRKIELINGRYQGVFTLSVKSTKSRPGEKESLIKIPVSLSTVPDSPGFVKVSSCQMTDPSSSSSNGIRTNITTTAGRVSPTWGGGGGGEGPTYQTCPNNHFVHALRVREGSRIDNLAVRCREMNGTSEYHFNSPGPGGMGGSPRILTCPAGSYVYGVSGREGSRIDALGLRCRNPETNALSSISPVGGGGGSSFSWNCPAGEYIFDIFTQSGNEIDGLSVRCSPP